MSQFLLDAGATGGLLLKIKTPLQKNDILKLKAGDFAELSGTVFTARDAAHNFLLEKNFGKIKKGVIYHCGPIIGKKKNKYYAISAGPTTSSRMNIYMPALIKKYGITAIIGKGGMDKKTLLAMKGKCVYFAAIGGLGATYAKCVKKVHNVYKKEFGMPEAIWELEIENFPLIVAMDARGNDLYEKVREKSHGR